MLGVGGWWREGDGANFNGQYDRRCFRQMGPRLRPVRSKKALSPNTVHLTILKHFANSIRTLQTAPRGRSRKLLILRFTPPGCRWPRLETTRSCRISSNIASWNAFLSPGGEQQQRETVCDERRARRAQESRSGSSPPFKAASCIKPRTAKCAISRP